MASLYRCSKWSTVHVKATCSRFLISSCAHANDICLKTKILWAVKVPCWTFVDRQRQALWLKVIEQTLRERRGKWWMCLFRLRCEDYDRSGTCRVWTLGGGSGSDSPFWTPRYLILAKTLLFIGTASILRGAFFFSYYSLSNSLILFT